MAVDFKNPHTRTSEYLFLPEDIKIKPSLNGRHDLPDISGLKADMLAQGQLQPVLIRKDGNHAVLCAGFSRYRAASEINKQGGIGKDKNGNPIMFKLRCVYFQGDERSGFLANVAENRFRNKTTELDDAHNIARLTRYGMSEEEIAEFYREDVAWVRKTVKLVTLCEEAQAALKANEIKPTAAQAIAKLSEEQQRKAMKAIGTGGAVAASIREASGENRNGKPSKAGLKEISLVLRRRLEEGKWPTGFSIDANTKPEVAVDLFIEFLQAMIAGTPTAKAEAV